MCFSDLKFVFEMVIRGKENLAICQTWTWNLVIQSGPYAHYNLLTELNYLYINQQEKRKEKATYGRKISLPNLIPNATIFMGSFKEFNYK